MMDSAIVKEPNALRNAENDTEENYNSNDKEKTTNMETIEMPLKVENVADDHQKSGEKSPELADCEEPQKKNEVQEASAIEKRTNFEVVKQLTAPIIQSVVITKQAPKTNDVSASGLSLLAQYDSDPEGTQSDADSVVEVATIANADYRNQVVEIASGTDSESSAESDVEFLSEIRKVIGKGIAESNFDDDDEDEEGNGFGKGKKRQPPKVKGEMLLEDLPPIQDLHITVPEAECIELGRVHSFVEQLVLVSALPNSVLLDLETVLFLEKGQKVLGEIFDVLGQVADPVYCVRFNSQAQIAEKGILIGDIVYVAPKTEYTQFVILSNLMKVRGSDASWENDVEPPPRYLDYSDDEQEREARIQLRNKDRPNESGDAKKRSRVETTPIATENTQSQPHQQRRRATRDNRTQRHVYNQYDNFNASSWHSNYYQPIRNGPSSHGGPHNYHMQPPPGSQYAPPVFIQPPPGQAHFNPYSQPPPMTAPVYVYNSFAMQPHAMASTSPPPPPPGAQ